MERQLFFLQAALKPRPGWFAASQPFEDRRKIQQHQIRDIVTCWSLLGAYGKQASRAAAAILGNHSHADSNS
jgi:hypothetical protein